MEVSGSNYWHPDVITRLIHPWVLVYSAASCITLIVLFFQLVKWLFFGNNRSLLRVTISLCSLMLLTGICCATPFVLPLVFIFAPGIGFFVSFAFSRKVTILLLSASFIAFASLANAFYFGWPVSLFL